MDKQQILLELKQMAQSGRVSRDEVLSVFAVPAHDSPTPSHLSLSEIMYYIGGGIVFLGIYVLAYQNWDSFNSPLRILITLGSALAAFVVAMLLYRYENLKKIAQAFFLLSGLLAPLGLNVLFKETGVDVSADNIQTLIYFLLSFIFLGNLYFFRQSIVLFFGIMYASILFHFALSLIISQNLVSYNYSEVWQYSILCTGLVWMLLGYYFRYGFYKALTGVLYGFGALSFLGAAMALGGWQPNQNIFWELVYPLLVFGIIFLSIPLKSKAFLTFGSLFLIGYILKLTAEYFSSGLGWPLALVLAGLIIIGVGYYAVRINKKYISGQV